MPKKNSNLCSVCGEGHLHKRVVRKPVEYKGYTAEVTEGFFECDVCDAHYFSSAQKRSNLRHLNAFHKRVDKELEQLAGCRNAVANNE